MSRAPYDLYVLVHPELFPSEDPDVSGVHDDGVAYAEAMRDAIRMAGGRVLMITDDEYELDEYERTGYMQLNEHICPETEQITIVDAVFIEAPFTPKIAQRALTESGLDARRVLIGGYHRADCVAKVRRALVRMGVRTRLHSPSTLPLRRWITVREL